MDNVFSLEDDYGDMFITQYDRVINECDGEKCEILPDPMDLNFPCVSLVSSQSLMHYSDISDDDDIFKIPSSQKHQNYADESKR